VDLYFCFNKPGVLVDEKNEQSIIPLINEDIYKELRKENVIHSGMIPKLDNAFEALKQGVQRVWIGKAENLLMAVKGKKAGTIIERQRYDLY
jgi:acetylglutamate kinase